jgi:homopolymeric O-antigen transport system ATP-binding protein
MSPSGSQGAASPYAITAEKLSKRYRLGTNRASEDTLMGSLKAWARLPFDNYRRLRQLSQFGEDEIESKDVIWAVKDVSFEIEHGERVGLIGRNGAGKSTVLKIIARIVEPTSGRATINGRVSSLLEVGTGFHPDLTGRENVYFNGILLGMSKAEMDRKFDEIVDFSGVEKFIDTQVKRYSSGMLVRLAFSVAAHLEPEVLLVDEVLAVGDASFQKKCMGKMEEVAQSGRTIVFVSHNLEAVRQLCPRAVLFDNGQIQADGPVDEVAELYLNRIAEKSFRFENAERGLSIEKVVLKNGGGQEVLQFRPGEGLIVEVHFDAKQRIERPYFWLTVTSPRGNCFSANMMLDGHRPEALCGIGVVRCRFKSLSLLPQGFGLDMGIRAQDGKEVLMPNREVARFTVTGSLERHGYAGEFQLLAHTSTPVVVPYEWGLPDGTTASVAVGDSGA